MASSRIESIKLNKQLWTDINKLKLMSLPTAPVRFLLTESPFDGRDDEEEDKKTASHELRDIVVKGQILPKSEIYKECSYLIEMKLTATFPCDPPEVRFVTKIYHPNIGQDGKFCHELLQKTARWSRTISLVDVIRALVKHIDNPDIDYSLSLELGREYMENKSVFDRKALDYVRKYGLPRF